LFHANGRTDKTKLIVAFRNFAKRPKNTPKFDSTERFIREYLKKILRKKRVLEKLIVAQIVNKFPAF
jgi:hypothetical protein